MLSQMSKTIGIFMSRLLVQLKLLTREVSLIASFSCLMSTLWFHQRFCSEPRFIIQILTNWVEFALIFWKTSGLQHFKSDLCFFQFKHWCRSPTWMILLTKRSLISGRLTKKVQSRKLKSGLSNMPPNEINDRAKKLKLHE